MGIALDHLAVVAPRLEIGVAYVRDVLGVTPVVGGRHEQMGTHNALLRLGEDRFLEIIAQDIGAPVPHGQQPWFGLGDKAHTMNCWNAGRRLRAMVARTSALAEALAVDPAEFGQSMRIDRGTRTWAFGVRSDGRLPGDGVFPHIMDWGRQGPAGPTLPDAGCRLLDLVVTTSTSARDLSSSYLALGFEGAPRIAVGADEPRLIAAIQTPSGVRILT